MNLRRLSFGLIATIALLLLAACQASSTQTAAPAVATSAAIPGLTPGQPSTEGPSTGTPEAAPTKADVPASSDVSHRSPTPQPAATEETGQHTASATQPISSQSQPQSPVFYMQNGLTLEYYWPLDPLSNLSADEMEIFAYNESDGAIEFLLPEINFTENGTPLAQRSGTWEKFSSRSNWDRIEYIQIPPSPYQGETLVLLPGEKAKLHWHIEAVTSTSTHQQIVLDLSVATASGSWTITPTLVRGSGESDIVVVAAPEPTQEADGSLPSPSHEVHSETTKTAGATSSVLWRFDGTEWLPSATPPDCAEPTVFQTPVNLDMVTSALWPGQQRGAYVAHGGFRFDGLSPDDITVRAPVGAYLVQAGRYLEGVDEQYLLMFSVPCGFFYRFDHVRTLPAKLADALEGILPPISTDSRTYYLNPPLWIERGEVVATSVGIAPSNIFVDFGLYDVRQPNNVAPNPAWADLFANDKEFGHYGVCFFDYLPGNDGDTMRSLPTGKEGKTSDYCE